MTPQRLLIQADAARPWPLPAGFANCLVTSPPYWGARSYKAKPQRFREIVYTLTLGADHHTPPWTGQLGHEKDWRDYVGHLVQVIRQAERVMRPDGVVWINIGDNHHTSGSRALVPAFLASALAMDGWLVRMENIWYKPSPSPEPRKGWHWTPHMVKVKDAEYDWRDGVRNRQGVLGEEAPHHQGGGHAGMRRATRDKSAKYAPCPGCSKCDGNDGLILKKHSWRHTAAHEYVLMLTRQMGYWSDHAVAKGASVGQSLPDRNPLSVFAVETAKYGGGHFAVFPEDLIAPLIQATCPRLVCPRCGEPYAPVIMPTNTEPENDEAFLKDMAEQEGIDRNMASLYRKHTVSESARLTSYRPTCKCPLFLNPRPGWVIDPFCGSGTSGVVSAKLGLNFVGLDLSTQYLDEEARLNVLGQASRKAYEGLPLLDLLNQKNQEE